MKYFLDTEFIEKGRAHPLTLISIGIVAEDGRELYAHSSEYSLEDTTQWLDDNVIPHVKDVPQQSVRGIVIEVLDFVGTDPTPEFWAYYADYDWVVFCQMFGTMMDLPKGWPMYCRDLKQLSDEVGIDPPKQQEDEHSAIADARWVKQAWEYLQTA